MGSSEPHFSHALAISHEVHIAEKYIEKPPATVRQFEMRSEAVSRRNGSLGLLQFPHLAVGGLVAFNGRGITELPLDDCISGRGRSHRPVVEMELESISEFRGSGWKLVALVDLIVWLTAS